MESTVKKFEFVYPVWEMPEVQEKVKGVKKYIVNLCRTRNFFGWKDFISDLLVDMEMWVYHYEDLHLQGKYKEMGVGAYANMALQGALNYNFYCEAKCRRLNYESASLDAMIETPKGEVAWQVEDPQGTEVIQKVDLLMAIGQTYGDRVQELVKKLFDGFQLSKEELKELKQTEGLQDWLHEQMAS